MSEVCPFKYEDGNYYDLEDQLVPVSNENHGKICCPNCNTTVINMNTYYCVLQYNHKEKYRECVGEDKCPIMKK